MIAFLLLHFFNSSLQSKGFGALLECNYIFTICHVEYDSLLILLFIVNWCITKLISIALLFCNVYSNIIAILFETGHNIIVPHLFSLLLPLPSTPSSPVDYSVSPFPLFLTPLISLYFPPHSILSHALFISIPFRSVFYFFSYSVLSSPL